MLLGPALLHGCWGLGSGCHALDVQHLTNYALSPALRHFSGSSLSFKLGLLIILRVWGGGMTRQFRDLATFAKDLGLILSTRMTAHNCPHRQFQDMCEDQKTTRESCFSSSTIGVLGIKFGASGLVSQPAEPSW